MIQKVNIIDPILIYQILELEKKKEGSNNKIRKKCS